MRKYGYGGGDDDVDGGADYGGNDVDEGGGAEEDGDGDGGGGSEFSKWVAWSNA